MFCEVQGRGRDVFGKLVCADAERLVECFVAPAKCGLARSLYQAPTALIVPNRLGRNILVYVYRELDKHWRADRVQDNAGDGLYACFSHKDDTCVPDVDVLARWQSWTNQASRLTNEQKPVEVCAKSSARLVNSSGAAFRIQPSLFSLVGIHLYPFHLARRFYRLHSGARRSTTFAGVIRKQIADDLH